MSRQKRFIPTLPTSLDVSIVAFHCVNSQVSWIEVTGKKNNVTARTKEL